LIKGYLIILEIAVARPKGAKDNIRNKIGSNSEKEFNNSKFLNDSEVESKASTPLFFEKDSSRSPKAGV
jgi:hypothetical protein